MKKLVVLLFLVFAHASMATTLPKKGDLSVTMYKLWHGDMMLVTLPNGKIMVVDTGYKRSPKKYLFPELTDRGVTKIDYLVLTHPDIDHIGGAGAILKRFKVGEIWYNGKKRDSKPFRRWWKIAKSKNIPILTKNTGDVVILDDTLVTFYGTQAKTIGHTKPDPHNSSSNDTSLVFKITWRTFSMLFTGDIGYKVQEKLAKKYGKQLTSRVYKVAHHGDKHSKAFIDAVYPQFSVCPCLSIPFWMHPSKTAKTLLKQGLYNSVRKSGNITVFSDGFYIGLDLERGEQGGNRRLGKPWDEL